MKGILDWQTREVVDIYDEVSLWSAPFGKLLLENIPMKKGATVLDIGFGPGFPLIELAQRFGSDSRVYGIDLWTEAISKAREKIRVLGLENVFIFSQSAEEIPLEDRTVDLITSNLGVNNFANKTKVLIEVDRVLKSTGHLGIATNPTGTFEELFDLFKKCMDEMNFPSEINEKFATYLDHRSDKESIISEFAGIGLRLIRSVSDHTNFRFTNAMAVLDHSLIRIGFLESWLQIIPEERQKEFFDLLLNKIDEIIHHQGEFVMSVPILYLEFGKL